MVDGVDESDSYVCMVVRHQNNVKQFFTLWVQLPQTSVDSFQSLSSYRSQVRRSRQLKGRMFGFFVCPVYVCVTLTLTKGKAGPGEKGSFSCSIWYLRYSSTPFCSNTFCSRSVRNKTREETAIVTAFSGLGCTKTQRQERENNMIRKIIVMLTYAVLHAETWHISLIVMPVIYCNGITVSWSGNIQYGEVWIETYHLWDGVITNQGIRKVHMFSHITKSLQLQ